MNFFLEQHKHLYAYQFGFCMNYSTALMTTVERIQKQFDAGNYTAGVSFDFKRAFDTVNHIILLEKLDYYVAKKEVLLRNGFALTWTTENCMSHSVDLIHL